MLMQILCVLALIGFWFYWRFTFWKRQGIPNDLTHFTRVYNMPTHMSDIITVGRHGKMVGVYNIFNPALLLSDAELAKEVLSTRYHDFVNHFKFASESSYMGECVLNLHDDRWRKIRALVTPAFTPAKLRLMQPSIEESCRHLIGHFDSKNGQVVDVKESFVGYTMDVVASSSFGTQVNTAKDPDNIIARMGRAFLSVDASLSTILSVAFPWLAVEVLGLTFFPKTPAKFFNDLTIDVLKKRRSDPSTRRNDFIQFMSEAECDGEKLTDKQIADNGIVFFLAGHEASGTTLSNIAYILALNPEVQDKLVAEIDQLVETQEVTFDSVHELTYLEAVLHETLRWLPPALRIPRCASRDTTLGKAFLPKGTLVMIAVYMVQRDPDNFYRPDEFLPERFLPGWQHPHKKEADIAFAYGPRNCFGKTFALFMIKLCLIRVLSKFRFEKCPETEKPLEFVSGQVVMQVKRVPVRIVRRS